jgi:hypothetical protein
MHYIKLQFVNINIFLFLYSVDVSQFVDEAKWRCLKGEGLTFANVRAFRSTGTPDPNGVRSIIDARKAGRI